MKAKLIKKKEGWYNLYRDNIGIGSTHAELQGFKLSIKNCEAIERDYDLDALVDEVYPVPQNSIAPIITMNLATRRAFKAGFQKALELMGDKKFSEAQMREAYDRGFILGGTPGIDRYIQALQQTEWDVEVEMEYYHNGNFVEDGKTHPVTIAWRPKVDEDGFIILKRI